MKERGDEGKGIFKYYNFIPLWYYTLTSNSTVSLTGYYYDHKSQPNPKSLEYTSRPLCAYNSETTPTNNLV